jgi:DNA-binding response OmpR family regulator
MKLRILIVDDSLTVRMDLSDALQAGGFDTVLCADIRSAKEALVQERADLLILDVLLSDGSGLDFLEELRRSEATSQVPVLLLTTQKEIKSRVQTMDAGAVVFIGKPYDLEEVVIQAQSLTQVNGFGEGAFYAASGPSVLGAKRLLAVDDSITYLQELASQLREENYVVILASSGEEALKCLATEPVDGILLDLIMPGLSGQEACKRIKQQAKWRDIPLIMITAHDDRDAMIECINAGADDYIAKSADFEVLKVRLRAHLRRKHFEDENHRIREKLVRSETEATARKHFEQALQETNVEMQIAKSVAEKANLAKSDFLSGMSHELRSPLNAILGFAQLMGTASPPPSDSQQESITQILQAGWHLLKLINEILDLAVVESGKVSLSLEPVSLSEVLSECQTMMEAQAQQRGIFMTFPLFEQPSYVWADQTRLKQIVINLLSNAIKYNQISGQVSVDYTVLSADRIRISFKDTGAGLTSENIEQLFQPFNRLGQEAGSVSGTGIGLVVTKQLVELMGGVLGVDSIVNEGSVFWFELRSTPAPEFKLKEPEHATPKPAMRPIDAPQKILLYIEDNAANMRLVERLIDRRTDIKLLKAVDGSLGIALAKASLPDVILMDINLPGISGIDALKVLREDVTTAHIPVVAISANAMSRDIEVGRQLGFFRYLTKPIVVEEFMSTLDLALRLNSE